MFKLNKFIMFTVLNILMILCSSSNLISQENSDINTINNYDSLRYAFLEECRNSSIISKYVEELEEIMLDSASNLWSHGNKNEAVKMYYEILSFYPYSLGSLRKLVDVLALYKNSADDQQLKERFNKEQEKHLSVLNGVIASIEKSGDGKSANTAYKIISLSEEKRFIIEKGFKFISEKSIVKETNSYIVATVQEKSGNELEIYFDVSLFLAFDIRK